MADNKKSAVVSRKMPSLAPITKRSQPLPALIPVSQASGSGVPVRGSVSKAREMPALCPIVKTSVKRKLPMDIKMQSLSDELSAGVVSNMMHEIVPSKKALGSINLNENRLSEPQILINRPLVNYSSSESDDDDEMENVCSDFSNNLDDQDSEDPNTIHDLYPPMPEDYEWESIETAFTCRIQTARIYPHSSGQDEMSFLNEVKEFLYFKIRAMQELFDIIKINLRLECMFTKLDDIKTCNFKCCNFIVCEGSDLSLQIEQSLAKILVEIDEFIQHASGWAFSKINHLDVCINKCDPLYAGSFIELPKWLKDKKCIINLKNFDNDFCFKLAVLCGLHLDIPNPKANPNIYLKYMDDLNFSDITFPVRLTDIPKFEMKNSIKINVLTFKSSNKKIYPLYYNTKCHHDRVVNLLYIKTEDNSHYCTITDISRLLSTQVNMHGHYLFFCMNCLNHFTSQKILTKHEKFCHLHETALIDLPMEKPFCKFMDFNKCYRVPFVAYADFECLLVPTNEQNKMQDHVISSFAYIIRGDHDNFLKYVSYRGANAGAEFVKSIYKDAQHVFDKYLKTAKDIIMTGNDWKVFKRATKCKLCEKDFKLYRDCQQNNSFKNDYKVLDHDHISGKFRNALCNACNLLCRQPFFMPVVFHNGSKYDFHLFVKHLFIENTDISVIASTDETYISISKKVDVGEKRSFSLRFLDSYRFLPYSLETLASSLTVDQAKYTVNEFPKHHELMRRKGCFPYDYITGFDKYEQTFLPSKKDFFSKLNNSAISDADYQHALNVWQTFNIKTLGDYSDLYLKSDCYLLCDIMETFRSTCDANYKLDPLQFYTAPSLSWAAMLKFTKVCLQLLTNYDMILFVEQGIRGGVSQVSHRYAEANIPNTQSYDSTIPPSHLLLLDINNLYGKAMAESLPIDGFVWLTQEQCKNLDVSAIEDNSKQGYILEVDLKYPEDLHNKHNEFPLAPQKHVIPTEWVSPYIADNFKPLNTPKLLTTLHDKSHYIIHYKTLKLYISLGMQLTCIHRGLIFNQSPWLKPYIEFNTNLRQTTSDSFGKEFYKLMVNSIFGKTMENCCLYKRIVFCQSWERARKYIAKPSFKETKVFSDNLIAIHLLKEKVIFNKPIFLGMSILDLSKHCVYDFHYNVMVAKYKNDLTLCYTDTDSYFYWLKNHNFYDDLKESNFKQYFDLSNYPPSHPLAFQSNKMVLGKVKDESASKYITHFVGLRSKMYSYLLEDGSATKKIKGIKKCTIKNDISFEDYVSCLNMKQSHEKPIRLITSRLHNISTISTMKKALCHRDDKKYISPDDGITCTSYGHMKLYK